MCGQEILIDRDKGLRINSVMNEEWYTLRNSSYHVLFFCFISMTVLFSFSVGSWLIGHHCGTLGKLLHQD